jgi:hypothetical protein
VSSASCALPLSADIFGYLVNVLGWTARTRCHGDGDPARVQVLEDCGDVGVQPKAWEVLVVPAGSLAWATRAGPRARSQAYLSRTWLTALSSAPRCSGSVRVYRE